MALLELIALGEAIVEETSDQPKSLASLFLHILHTAGRAYREVDGGFKSKKLNICPGLISPRDGWRLRWLTAEKLSRSIPALCLLFLHSFSLQKLISRSTLRRQGKEGSKEGNGIGVNSSSRFGIDNFEFIRVLGKGSFGKVSLGCDWLNWSNKCGVCVCAVCVHVCMWVHTGPSYVYPHPQLSSLPHAPSCISLGDASQDKGNRRPVCCEGAEEGRDPAGWRCGMHHDGEEDPVLGPQPPLPHPAVLLLSDSCEYDQCSLPPSPCLKEAR